ncbi:ABC-type lipoprotein release transport system permease subunit [Geothermobacter ehrlichii]|uniref:ABC-type lipoprotein release transport system permease subunit n=1 Tax=Geothermobacter ehrlichii TaxID=213224 RepID=A0A5D3WIT8_9BACT|nr:ABC transporter permease [Geothermobacter ehrlichii]TYO97109.1 ABC-type lipoprotein release transport system permease subunit [Geothermobacter ehrlichii]
MRQLKLLEFALASLWRRRWKTGSILVVYILTVAALASILLLTRSLQKEAQLLLSEAPELVVQRLEAGRHALIPASTAERLRSIPGVGEVRPRVWGYYYDALTGANYTLVGVDGKTGAVRLLQGRLPREEGECAVGRGVAAIRMLEVGDDLILIDGDNLGVSLQVVGIFDAPSNLLTNDLVLMERQALAAFFNLPAGMVTDIAVEVRNPNEVDTVARKVRRLMPDSRPITRHEILRTYDAVFNWRSGMLLSIFLAALLAFVILAWDKATGLSAEEKREIGILKATGWDTADVLLLKFWEGTVVSVIAVLVGMLLAWIHVFFLGAPLLAMVIKGWSVLFPAFDLVPRVDPQQLLVLVLLTTAPYVVATVVPSWRAATLDPDTVMRG